MTLEGVGTRLVAVILSKAKDLSGDSLQRILIFGWKERVAQKKSSASPGARFQSGYFGNADDSHQESAGRFWLLAWLAMVSFTVGDREDASSISFFVNFRISDRYVAQF